MIGTQLVVVDQDESSSGPQNDIIDIDVMKDGSLITSISLAQCSTPTPQSLDYAMTLLVRPKKVFVEDFYINNREVIFSSIEYSFIIDKLVFSYPKSC